MLAADGIRDDRNPTGSAEARRELLTPQEAAGWFRRSTSWLRRQRDLLRLGGPGRQPLYHLRACRAYVLGRMRGLAGDALREFQLAALASEYAPASGPPAPGGAEAARRVGPSATAMGRDAPRVPQQIAARAGPSR